MKKKILSFLMAAIMLATVSACNGNQESSGSSPGGSSSGTGSGSSNQEEASWKPVDSSQYEADAAAGETDDRAFMKFENTVDVHIGRSVNATDTSLEENGSTVEDNYFTKYLKDTYNINVITDWYTADGANYNQKVSTLIASNSLPDALVTSERSYMLTAAKDGQLADLGDVFNQYASRQVLDIVGAAGDVAIDKATYEGALYCLPGLDVQASEICVYFIRQDWLDELNLDVPKTTGDLEKAAKAFIDAGKCAYAIEGPAANTRTYCTFLASSPGICTFDAVYQACNATPGYFLEGEDGKVYYGSTTAEFKNSLELLSKWYADGLINPEMGVQTDSMQNINAGKVGIYMCSWWGLGYGNFSSFQNDPTANWQSYPLYTDDGEWNIHMGNLGNGYTLVNKNVSEDVKKAVIVMNNIHVRDEAMLVEETKENIGYFPLRNNMAASDESEYTHNVLLSIARGETTIDDYDLEGTAYKHLREDILSLPEVFTNMDWAKEDFATVNDMDTSHNNFARMYSLMITDRPAATLEPDNVIRSVSYSMTENTEKYWTNLIAMEDEFVQQVITGKKSIDEFDTFVSDWTNQGGADILQDMQNIVDGNE